MRIHPDPHTTAPMREAIWTAVSAQLRQRLEPGPYKVWIEPLSGCLDGTELVVHAVSSFAANFVRDHFLPAIRDAVTAVAGENLPVRITEAPLPEMRPSGVSLPGVFPKDGAGPGEGSEVRARDVAAQAAPAFVATPHRSPPGSPSRAVPSPAGGQYALPMRYDDAPLSISVRQWRHSFEDFVVGPCNELAFAASRSICKERRGADTLFLSSTPGLGKTHLIQAVGRQLYEECNFRVPKVEYLTAEEFASRLVMAIKSNDTDKFKARYRETDVLLLEDVHFLQGKEKTQEELLATVKTLQERGGKVIFSSSFMPRDLQGMNGELLSRLHSGFLAVIDRPDSAMRKKIFTEKARLIQVALPEDVSDFLAESLDSDVRQIESCLRNLALKAKLLKSGITMQMAWEAVQYYAPCEKRLDLEKIIAYVTRGYGISAAEMRSKSRKKDLVVARNTVFFLARKHTDLSLEKIGTFFGRSHSTVIKGITSLEREMSRETSLGRQIAGAIAIIERNGGIISPSL